jgi:hypothetical protein
MPCNLLLKHQFSLLQIKGTDYSDTTTRYGAIITSVTETKQVKLKISIEMFPVSNFFGQQQQSRPVSFFNLSFQARPNLNHTDSAPYHNI